MCAVLFLQVYSNIRWALVPPEDANDRQTVFKWCEMLIVVRTI